MKRELTLPAGQSRELIKALKTRFEKNKHRHEGIKWEEVESKLALQPGILWSLNEMERTGGEPDVIGPDPGSGEYFFADFSAESPAGRRSLCYDRAGLESRKEARPGNSAMDLAAEMGVELLTEEQYRQLQKFGPFDQKTSSWIATPAEVRKLGGALFADYRFGRIFIYHNTAPSYYSARGFRACLRF